MRFLVDAQLPIALARFIRAAGHEATHVADIGLADADDPPIWQRAIIESEIIVTKDEDFVIRRMLTTTGPQIVWLRIGNCSNSALIIWFDSIWASVEKQPIAGDTLVEVV